MWGGSGTNPCSRTRIVWHVIEFFHVLLKGSLVCIVSPPFNRMILSSSFSTGNHLHVPNNLPHVAMASHRMGDCLHSCDTGHRLRPRLDPCLPPASHAACIKLFHTEALPNVCALGGDRLTLRPPPPHRLPRGWLRDSRHRPDRGLCEVFHDDFSQPNPSDRRQQTGCS